MAEKNALQKVLEIAGDFVTAQNGQWNHKEWESFLEEVSRLGFQLTDETKRYFGNILEAAKHLYPVAAPLPAVPAKKAAAKPKAKAKPKPKAK